MRLGLCCLFIEEDIRFRTTTASTLSRLSRKDRVTKIRDLATHNALSLHAAIAYCAKVGIGCFRVNSQILPLKTHPKLGYDTQLLGKKVVEAYQRCGNLAHRTNIRLSFHPDQFIVLNSPDRQVVEKSLEELEYQAEVAEWIGADVINIHAGGGYGGKPAALARLVRSIEQISDRVRALLTLENDDRIYTPSDLIPVCHQLGSSGPGVEDRHMCLNLVLQNHRFLDRIIIFVQNRNSREKRHNKNSHSPMP